MFSVETYNGLSTCYFINAVRREMISIAIRDTGLFCCDPFKKSYSNFNISCGSLSHKVMV